MSVYLSTTPSAYEELFYKYIKCDCIYSKEFKDGTLYCVIHTTTAKKHSTLDNIVKLIEVEIGPGSSGSSFQCISDVLSKKVKTFAARAHMQDELFSAIFTSTTTGCQNGRKLHADVRTWVPPSETADAAGALATNSKAAKRRRVGDDPAGGATTDGLNAKVAELERRLGASEAKEREAQAINAALEQRLGGSEAKEREVQATNAALEQRLGASEAKEREAQAKVVELEQRAVASEVKVKELEQRLGASEAKEREAQAKVVELEQRAVASEATIAELEQCLGATEAKIGELGEKAIEMGERVKTVNCILEHARAEMKRVDGICLKWKAFGETEHESAKLWSKRVGEAEAKVKAWDAYIGRINDNLMRQAMGDFMTTPLQKMVNFAKLAGVVVQPTDTYHEVRKNVLLKVHPDKRRCAFDKDALFERICVAVGEMPAHA
jgi:hypothetical protein